MEQKALRLAHASVMHHRCYSENYEGFFGAYKKISYICKLKKDINRI